MNSKSNYIARQRSMLRVDLRRMLTTPLLYILVGASLVMPILILVMTTMVGAAPQTGAGAGQEAMATFTNVWQIIGATSTAGGGMSMDLTSMCNSGMMYFIIAVLVCVFISEDFKSGYCKNLFTTRADKLEYVVSKTLVGIFGGALMMIAFFVGGVVGGAIAGLPFDMVGFNGFNLACCMLSKILLVSIFVSIYVVMSIVAKQRTWLSMILSFGVGMFLFNIAPMVSPLDSGAMNIVLCLAGGVMFAVGLGAVSNLVLKKTNII